jgi:hypothetical protein
VTNQSRWFVDDQQFAVFVDDVEQFAHAPGNHLTAHHPTCHSFVIGYAARH